MIIKQIQEGTHERHRNCDNTLEIPEIMKVADRCIVFYDGHMIKELAHEEINEQRRRIEEENAKNSQ